MPTLFYTRGAKTKTNSLAQHQQQQEQQQRQQQRGKIKANGETVQRDVFGKAGREKKISYTRQMLNNMMYSEQQAKCLRVHTLTRNHIPFVRSLVVVVGIVAVSQSTL